MARLFAQYANAGKYSLEVVYSEVDKKWDWWAKVINASATHLPEFTGSATTSEQAKKDSMASIGLVIDPGWKDMGPDVNVPD